jgi:signal transduction histidine kinase
MNIWPKDRNDLYGAFAFTIVVLSCHLGYFYTNRFYTPAEMVPLAFGLSAVYAATGIFSNLCLRGQGWHKVAYFVFQSALLAAVVWTSPLRGFYGILVLPLVSQSVFEFGWRGSALITVYLYSLCVSVWAIPYGWGAGVQALVNYSAAFVFTVIFTIITKQALLAREREEHLRRELEAANAQLRAQAAQTAELATTRERNRLAREIHDGVGHYLTVVKTQLDAAAALVATDPARARSAIDKAARLAHDALEDVRRSVGTLRTRPARRCSTPSANSPRMPRPSPSSGSRARPAPSAPPPSTPSSAAPRRASPTSASTPTPPPPRSRSITATPAASGSR